MFSVYNLSLHTEDFVPDDLGIWQIWVSLWKVIYIVLLFSEHKQLKSSSRIISTAGIAQLETIKPKHNLLLYSKMLKQSVTKHFFIEHAFCSLSSPC